MHITYRTDLIPTAEQIVELYNNSGLPRPTGDIARIQQMYNHANLVVTAWEMDQLVGVSRSLTDFCWCCYLADLAVRQEYKEQGIGRKLIELTKEQAGPNSMVLLLSVPTAMDYYPNVGFQQLDNAFLLPRDPY